MLDMRLNLPTLMTARGMKNAYALMKASKGELTITTATRLVAADGKPKRIDMTTLDTLCRIFGVQDMNVLLARDDEGPDATPPETPAVATRKRPGSKRATKGKATPKAKGRQSRAA